MTLSKEVGDYILNDYKAQQADAGLHYLKNIDTSLKKINRSLTRLILVGCLSFFYYEIKDTEKVKEIKTTITTKFDELKKEFKDLK